MIEFLLTFTVLILVVTGMALGVIVQNKPIKGSCGGMAALGIDTSCDICGGDAGKCEEEQEKSALAAAQEDLSYDASKG